MSKYFQKSKTIDIPIIVTNDIDNSYNELEDVQLEQLQTANNTRQSRLDKTLSLDSYIINKQKNEIFRISSENGSQQFLTPPVDNKMFEEHGPCHKLKNGEYRLNELRDVTKNMP
jgi:hypothetical protein